MWFCLADCHWPKLSRTKPWRLKGQGKLRAHVRKAEVGKVVSQDWGTIGDSGVEEVNATPLKRIVNVSPAFPDPQRLNQKGFRTPSPNVPHPCTEGPPPVEALAWDIFYRASLISPKGWDGAKGLGLGSPQLALLAPVTVSGLSP
jgi:hypothetical protein